MSDMEKEVGRVWVSGKESFSYGYILNQDTVFGEDGYPAEGYGYGYYFKLETYNDDGGQTAVYFNDGFSTDGALKLLEFLIDFKRFRSQK